MSQVEKKMKTHRLSSDFHMPTPTPTLRMTLLCSHYPEQLLAVGPVIGILTRLQRLYSRVMTRARCSVTSGSVQEKVGKTEARGLIEKEPVGFYFIHSVGDQYSSIVFMELRI